MTLHHPSWIYYPTWHDFQPSSPSLTFPHTWVVATVEHGNSKAFASSKPRSLLWTLLKDPAIPEFSDPVRTLSPLESHQAKSPHCSTTCSGISRCLWSPCLSFTLSNLFIRTEQKTKRSPKRRSFENRALPYCQQRLTDFTQEYIKTGPPSSSPWLCYNSGQVPIPGKGFI